VTPVRYAAERYDGRLEPGALLGLTRLELAGARGPNASQRVAAMVAAKRAALRLCPNWAAADLEILRRHNAAPILRVAGQVARVQVSLSHAGGLAVAAVRWSGDGEPS
jgi:phosphopantetheinyl transferase (holo-ACP synthase)